MDALKNRVLCAFACSSTDELAEVLGEIHQLSSNPKNHGANPIFHDLVGPVPNNEID
jgi:hypothetical protein